MSFSYDIQTSSCLKPPDPFKLCLSHHKQQKSDSGEGARFGPQIFFNGEFTGEQALFFPPLREFLCSRGQEESAGTGPAPFQGDSVQEKWAMVYHQNGSKSLRQSAICEMYLRPRVLRQSPRWVFQVFPSVTFFSEINAALPGQNQWHTFSFVLLLPSAFFSFCLTLYKLWQITMLRAPRNNSNI